MKKNNDNLYQEAVDRLLYIAYKIQTVGAVARKPSEYLILQAVAVLKFIYYDKLKSRSFTKFRVL